MEKTVDELTQGYIAGLRRALQVLSKRDLDHPAAARAAVADIKDELLRELARREHLRKHAQWTTPNAPA